MLQMLLQTRSPAILVLYSRADGGNIYEKNNKFNNDMYCAFYTFNW